MTKLERKAIRKELKEIKEAMRDNMDAMMRTCDPDVFKRRLRESRRLIELRDELRSKLR